MSHNQKKINVTRPKLWELMKKMLKITAIPIVFIFSSLFWFVVFCVGVSVMVLCYFVFGVDDGGNREEI